MNQSKGILLSELIRPAINLKELEGKEKKAIKSALTAAKGIDKDCQKVMENLEEVLQNREAPEQVKMTAKLLLTAFKDVCGKMCVVMEKIGDYDTAPEVKVGDNKDEK